MHFLNPKTDFAFKRIFGSDRSKNILLSFLNAILGLESPYRIADLTILDPYLAPKILGIKDTYLDVRAQDEQGKSYIIEMQVLNVAAFEKRVLYNARKTYARQIDRGEEGREEGREEERRRIARALLDVIADDALIAQKTGLSVERVRALR